MKDPSNRMKVVLRHLPPALSKAALVEQIDGRFSGRYKWVCFRPGKNSQKNQQHSRAYIVFKKPEYVIEFAEFFDGHIFVNEKGAQFKALVEYAPSQRAPKLWLKEDVREGTIFKDLEYLEFLEHLAKPVESLPSAEVQLERREAEKAGGPKQTLIVTPLMEFVRQKRAAKSGSQRSLANGKISRRPGGASPSSSSPSKQGSEKRRITTSMYVLRDNTKNSSGKDKSTHILVPRREEQLLLDKSVSVPSERGTQVLEDESASGGVETGKRRAVLIKGKAKEVSCASGDSSRQQNGTTSVRDFRGPIALKQSQRNEASGRIIRSFISNKDVRPQSQQQTHALNLEKDKRPPRPPNIRPKAIFTGSHGHVGLRETAHGLKEVDDCPNFCEGKSSKRGTPAGYGSHERKVWVQKTGSAS